MKSAAPLRHLVSWIDAVGVARFVIATALRRSGSAIEASGDVKEVGMFLEPSLPTDE